MEGKVKPYGRCTMDERRSLTQATIDERAEAFDESRANRVAKRAVCAHGLREAARASEAVGRNPIQAFDVEVSQGDRADQMRSGRCWMFAALNTFRFHTIKRYRLKTFELSQSYPLYFDKLEKSNWFLENVLDTLDEPLTGRLMAHLLSDPVGDGGQWDMFANLTRKYGVVPKEAMPETACSKNTRDMDKYLTRYLRGCAARLRDAHAQGESTDALLDLKQQMMAEVQALLTICLGEPPRSFEVRLRDKDDKLVLTGTFTPQDFFAEAVGIDLDDYVSLISAPTADKPFGHTYTVSRLGNVYEDGQVRYLNLELSRLKACALAQLEAGLPVWFGCDVDQCFLREDGIMDTAAVALDDLVGFAVEGCLDRAQRLDYGESLMTHAMVLEGANIDADGNPTLWKVENSWGDKHGRNGFDTLSDAWFDQYVYQVVVERRFLSDEERAMLETKPISLEPWDPMGSLACTD